MPKDIDVKHTEQSAVHKDLAQQYLNIAGTMIMSLNRDGEISQINLEGCKILNYEEFGELIGLNWFDNFLPENIREEYRSKFNESLGGKFDKVGWTAEVPFITSSGELRQVSWNNVLLTDSDGNIIGTLSSVVDVTDLKINEYRLRIKNRISEIFLTVPDDEMYFEVLKVILDALESEYGIFGYLDEEGNLVVPSITRHIWDQCDVPEKDIVFPCQEWGDSIWPTAIRTKKLLYSNEPSLHVPEGHVPILRNISVPIIMHDAVIGLFQVANKKTDYDENDISHAQHIADMIAPVLDARLKRERTEAALMESRKFELMVAELEAKNAELERFTYIVSHDLKSPLITIKGFLGVLEQDIQKGDFVQTSHDIARITKAADKMELFLEDILELSRIGRMVHEPEDIGMDDVITEALERVAGQIERRGVRVVREPCEITAHADTIRLIEVAQNLLSNAVQFMGDQSDPEINIECRQDGDEIYCCIRDNGIGIEPEYHEKIFGLFDKLDAESEGTGVGLAIAKRIIEVIGGRVWVESEGAGLGSTFVFTIPTKEAGDN